MSEQTTLLEKLEGLLIRFEEIGTLITDPAVIGDMKRFVKLTKEYRDLEKISEAAKRYKQIPVSYTHLTLPTIQTNT